MGMIASHIQGAWRLFLAAAFLCVLGIAPVHAAEAPNQPELEPSVTIGSEPTALDAEEQATPGHAADTGEHKSGGLPQLDFTTYSSQLFWMAIIFFVLYLVMSKKALPEIGSIVENRKGIIDENLKSAEAMRAEAAAIQAAYEQNLNSARSHALKAVRDVELAASKKAAEQVEAFRRKSEAAITAAESNVQAAKMNAMGQMTSVAAEVASLAAEKITGVSADRQKAQAIVETIAGKAKAA